MTEAQVNSYLLLGVGTFLTFASTWFWTQRNNARDKANALALEHGKLLGRVTDLEAKLAVLNQAVIPISTAFQAILIKELTHYHTPEMDALLVKLGPPYVLTQADEVRLASLLIARTADVDPLISDSERDAANILPAVIRRVRIEAENLSASGLRIKLVSVIGVLNERGGLV